MKPFIVILLATAVAAFASISPTGEISPHFRYITFVEGKAYFMDDTANRTWSEAKNYCENQGMRMAKIENDAQYYGLHGEYNETTFHGQFWTAGRDSLRRTQFIWDDVDQSPIPETADWFFSANLDFQFQTCVVFYNLVSHGILAADLCTEYKQVLCEVDVNE